MQTDMTIKVSACMLDSRMFTWSWNCDNDFSICSRENSILFNLCCSVVYLADMFHSLGLRIVTGGGGGGPKTSPSPLSSPPQGPSRTVSRCDEPVTPLVGCTCWRQTAVTGWSRPGVNTGWTMADGRCCKGGETALWISSGIGRITK